MKTHELRQDHFTDAIRARFNSKVIVGEQLEGPFYEGIGPCHVWSGGIGDQGYGVFRASGITKTLRAHHAAAVMAGLTIHPKGQVLHRCDNKACVNPAHLYIGSHQDNMDDMKNRMRSKKGDESPARIHIATRPRGSKQGLAKLDETKVAEILTLYFKENETAEHLSRCYGVSSSAVKNILKGTTWAHVKVEGIDVDPERNLTRRGSDVVGSKIKESDVIFLRSNLLSLREKREAANRMGLSLRYLGQVIRKERWKHL